MISRVNAPFRKLLLNSNFYNTPVATQQSGSVYFKPFLLATAATVLLSFIVGFVFIALAGNPSAASKNPDVQLNISPTKHTQLLLQDSSVYQNDLKRFTKSATQKNLAGFKQPAVS